MFRFGVLFVCCLGGAVFMMFSMMGFRYVFVCVTLGLVCCVFVCWLTLDGVWVGFIC